MDNFKLFSNDQISIKVEKLVGDKGQDVTILHVSAPHWKKQPKQRFIVDAIAPVGTKKRKKAA